MRTIGAVARAYQSWAIGAEPNYRPSTRLNIQQAVNELLSRPHLPHWPLERLTARLLWHLQMDMARRGLARTTIECRRKWLLNMIKFAEQPPRCWTPPGCA